MGWPFMTEESPIKMCLLKGDVVHERTAAMLVSFGCLVNNMCNQPVPKQPQSREETEHFLCESPLTLIIYLWDVRMYNAIKCNRYQQLS